MVCFVLDKKHGALFNLYDVICCVEWAGRSLSNEGINRKFFMAVVVDVVFLASRFGRVGGRFVLQGLSRRVSRKAHI